MAERYTEYDKLDLPKVAEEIAQGWKKESAFEASISSREGAKSFVFYEGPPSANGLPGIHHVMGRGIKDLFCRYKTLKGFQVKRKAGWDTHGLPIELGVEKELGITKEDIGKTISVEDYNNACRKAVMRYTDIWNDLTVKMGYWVDMENPYVTYENKYIESVWYLLGKIYDQGMLYKGYTIQPYSPAAGTGLSSHEINQPGCYKDVKDTTVVAKFKVKGDDLKLGVLNIKASDSLRILAWTTTPWTLPSNTALCVGSKIEYVLFKTKDRYTDLPYTGVIAKKRLQAYFSFVNLEDIAAGKKFKSDGKTDEDIEILGTVLGSDLIGLRYEQLLPYTLPYEDAEKAFQVISGDFVTTEDGTGIVHIAPTFGADDAKVAKEAGIPPMLVLDENETPVPLVDLQGRFRPEMGELAGRYVKNEYYEEGKAPERNVDVEISIKLKEEDKAFLVAKYEHSYPHCWRTDKPILYYPLDSWFIKTTAYKDRLIELNKTINWKPKSTGEGRFGNWLENLNDWNLSRSRYWGIPIPIWRTEDGTESVCISSVEQLKQEISKAVKGGLMKEDPLKDFVPGDMSKENYLSFDLHKNYVDTIVLVSDSGRPMQRESDLIDVWFDSGAMPYAQLHYPFENKELIDERKYFPADFIAEGVDQTRGWFFTLHAISTMCFDSIAYKSVVSNGLVLDKNGQKMSKRLGNAIDPFKTLAEYGPDATRWYMFTNAQPWDNLRFDVDGITEVHRKFFGTLYNTYSFFALYANVDGFTFAEPEVPLSEKRELDRWILSKLNSLIKEVEDAYENYEPTRAGRAIQRFTTDELSNWYVRLSRRIFWKGEYGPEKIAAYQTLFRCLEVIAQLSSPIAPFYMDRLYRDLRNVADGKESASVHLSHFPSLDKKAIDVDLEARMEVAQRISSLVLSIRKKEQIKVRQPLQKVLIPALDKERALHIQAISELVMSEVNVKQIELLDANNSMIVKTAKADFKKLGPKYGKQMKQVAAAIQEMDATTISILEQKGTLELPLEGGTVTISKEDVELVSQDIPGWSVASDGDITVALDITLTTSLTDEGLARELVNKVQNLRKDLDLEVTDRILVEVENRPELTNALISNKKYICAEILAERFELVDALSSGTIFEIDLNETLETKISIARNQ
jgi:isoleucyl-tRNA synthetase